MNTLALPTQTITPKPTRSEIITAMTVLRVQQLAKEQKENVERRKELLDKAEKLVRAWVVKNAAKLDASLHLGYVNDGKISGGTLDFRLREMPENITKLLLEIDKLPKRFTPPNEKEIRKDISEAMRGMASADERIGALVNSPETRATLEKCLEELIP